MSQPVEADPTPSPRRERRRLEMRSRIVEAGLDRFRSAGYETTTVAEVCEAADIAYGTFFNHFPTKLDLLREIVDESQKTLALRLEEISKGPGSTSDQLQVVFEIFAQNASAFGPGQRDLVEQMVTLGHEDSPAEKDRHLHTIFRSFLEAGVARGDVRKEDLDALTEVVLGAYTSITLGWVHFDDYPLRERAKAVASLLSRLLEPS